MKFKYEDLEIWKLSLELIETIYGMLKKFPREEKYDLVSQGKRAVVSIALNIAEGSGRHTDRDFSLSYRNFNKLKFQPHRSNAWCGTQMDTKATYDPAPLQKGAVPKGR